uniref:Cytochrome p450 n=1 Tax=Croton stellatopilosus TaxID=431156 RepID=A0A3G2CJX9_9ROSI|nr:cytochrome p450 [Croton stellatopilosus]
MSIIIEFLVLIFLVFVYVWIFKSSSVLINWPMVGMIPQLLWNASNIHSFATYVLEKSGGTFLFKGIWFVGPDFLGIAAPMDVQYILSRNFSNYHKGEEFKEIFEPFGDGIFNSDDESWSVQRNLIHSFLKDNRFELAAKDSLEQKILKDLFQVLDNASKLKSVIDIQDVFQRLTFDNICKMVLGIDPSSLCIDFHEVPFEKSFDELEMVFLYRHILPRFIWKFQKWLQIGEEKKFIKAWAIVDDFLNHCIARKKNQILAQEKMNGHDFDFLTFLLTKDDHQEEEKQVINSNTFLRDMAFNLLAAGRDTVGATLVWFFWLVGNHPHVEKKILEEIKVNLGDHGTNNLRFFSFDELKKLVYLHATLCEVLRLYPPVPFEHKMSKKSDVLPSGNFVPKNRRILFSFYSMGRMKDIWGEDCLEFKPERWISEKGKIKHFPSYKFIAFLSGPRTCLGKDLAFLSLKAVASAVLWNYSLEFVETHQITPKISILLYMAKGLKVKVSKRLDSSI